MEFIPSSALNFRDVAGACKTPALRRGALYRSASHNYVSEAESVEMANRLNIRTVVDLRGPKETSTDPGPRAFLKLNGFVSCKDGTALLPDAPERLASHRAVINMPFLNRNSFLQILSWPEKILIVLLKLLSFLFPAAERTARNLVVNKMNRAGLRGLYRMLLLHSQPQIRQTLQIISNPHNHGILVNCSHGKDRTGVTGSLVTCCSPLLIFPRRIRDALALLAHIL
jgi:hypothetical protein